WGATPARGGESGPGLLMTENGENRETPPGRTAATGFASPPRGHPSSTLGLSRADEVKRGDLRDRRFGGSGWAAVRVRAAQEVEAHRLAGGRGTRSGEHRRPFLPYRRHRLHDRQAGGRRPRAGRLHEPLPQIGRAHV